MDLKVRTSRNRLEGFDKEKIVDSLVKETKIDESHARTIADEVEKHVAGLHLKYLTAPLVREIVNVKLLEHGFHSARNRYTRLGMPVYDVRQLINAGSTENANIQHNPEAVHKTMGDTISKEYAYINILPPYLVDAHMSGDIHIHDLGYFVTRPYTFSHDLRFFLKNGIKIDGTGFFTASSGPAKRPDVAVLHAAKVLSAAQINCAGGQGLSFFNTFLAPYVKGMKKDELRQLMQLFVYELSQAYVGRGGQTVFSSINIDLETPEFLKRVPAVAPGGKTDGTYGDYQDEARKIFEALVDVFAAGDAQQKPFIFPHFEVHISKKTSDEDLLRLSELSSRFGTPYYVIHQDYMPKVISYQSCTYLMPLDPTDKEIESGPIRGGAMQAVTINLPKLGYQTNDEDTLFEFLYQRMNAARETLLLKREVIHKNMESSLHPFLAQKINSEAYYVPDRQSFIIGFIGLNELVKIHTGSEMHEDPSSHKFGLKVITRMREITDEFSEKTGLTFTLARSPAEAAGYRLAQIDLQNFGQKAFFQGTKSAPYYTNSFHIKPAADISVFERVELESKFHPSLNGGAMSNVWLGESDQEGLLSLTKKIIKTPAQYFTYTKDLSICNSCHKVSTGLSDKCPDCSGQTIRWRRITGYYQAISTWNPGKVSELHDRKRYDVLGGKNGNEG